VYEKEIILNKMMMGEKKLDYQRQLEEYLEE